MLYREGFSSDDSCNKPPSKKPKPTNNFQAGDYVCVHRDARRKHHVPCRIAEVVGGKYYRLRLCDGVLLSSCYTASELTPLGSGHHISLDGWRLSERVSFRKVISNPLNLEKCDCIGPIPNEVPIDLTKGSDVMSTDNEVQVHVLWVECSLYTLMDVDRKMIVSTEWLDKIITAVQLLKQQYPCMVGLQPPVLQQTLTFPVYRGEFVQLLNIRDTHWCVVTNVGCEEGVIKVYDSMYDSVSDVTSRTIASLVFSTAPKLMIKVMDVEKQKNMADCGVLSIAYAYDICSGMDPCEAVYDHTSIRNHLAKCLEDCNFSRFPVLHGKEGNRVKYVQHIELHCVLLARRGRHG